MKSALQLKRKDIQQRWAEFSDQRLFEMSLNPNSKPTWMKILENSHSMARSKNDEKRLSLPMPESDDVISFLSKAWKLVSELVVKRDESLGETDDKFYDGWQWVDIQIEGKEQYLLTLLWFIENRQIPRNFDFKDSYSWLSSFKNIEELYQYLIRLIHPKNWEVRTQEELESFILDRIPGYSWEIGLSNIDN